MFSVQHNFKIIPLLSLSFLSTKYHRHSHTPKKTTCLHIMHTYTCIHTVYIKVNLHTMHTSHGRKRPLCFAPEKGGRNSVKFTFLPTKQYIPGINVVLSVLPNWVILFYLPHPATITPTVNETLGSNLYNISFLQTNSVSTNPP